MINELMKAKIDIHQSETNLEIAPLLNVPLAKKLLDPHVYDINSVLFVAFANEPHDQLIAGQ